MMNQAVSLAKYFYFNRQNFYYILILLKKEQLAMVS